MTDKDKLLAVKVRLHYLKTNHRNEEAKGVIRKLERKKRNLEAKIDD